MAKVTRTERSDGSWEESKSQNKGCLYYLGMFVIISFVIAEAVKTWWVAAIIVLLVVLGVVGKLQQKGAK